MWVAFALQKLLTFFQQKISAYLHITWCKFNESLNNDVVSFEQLGPDFWHYENMPNQIYWKFHHLKLKALW